MKETRIEYKTCRIITSVTKYGGYLELEIESPLISRISRPGNFVMIRGWKGDSPILPRPFDILECSPGRGSFKLVIKITGKGTKLLGELKEGDSVTILGPLGRGIKVPKKTSAGKPVKNIGLLARGVGAAALVLLAEQARKSGIGVHTFITASEREKLVCTDYFEKYSDTIMTGWDTAGDKSESPEETTGIRKSENPGTDGRDMVRKFLETGELDILYTCGSRRFGRFVQELDKEMDMDGYLFMESRMACGVGDCHGCTVTTPDGEYLLVCQDGPVFPAAGIKI